MSVPLINAALPNYQSLAGSFDNPNSKIAQLSATGKPQQDFLYANINEFKETPAYKTMLVAQKYWENKPDILERKRYFYGRQGQKHELEILSNVKLCHPFIVKVVTQKINYMLTNDFEVTCKNEKYVEVLKSDYFNKKFSRLLKTVMSNAIVNGISWLQVYYDEAGSLSFKRIPSDQVVPFWADADHTELDAVIRFYTIYEYLATGGKKAILKVEFYDKTGVWYYEQSTSGLVPDRSKASFDEYGAQTPQAHFSVNAKDEEGNDVSNGYLWSKIPFVAFKYNTSEASILEYTKSLIDDYDTVTSDLSNNIQDTPNNVKVVKGFNGTDKEEFSINVARFRTIFVGTDGDVTNLNTPIDVTAHDSHVDRLRKDIHHFAAAVDTQETDLGNASGVAIRFRYGDLDNDMATLETQLQWSFEELAWFINIDLQGKGKGDFTKEEFEIEFNKVGIINESDTILDAKNSVGVISNKTILEHHPWVKDAAAEEAQLGTEREQAMKEAADAAKTMGADTFGFGNKSSAQKKPAVTQKPKVKEA